MNVIGDVGMMLAIFLMVRQFGTLTYTGVFAKAATLHSGDHVITALCLLLLVGAIAKSAQCRCTSGCPTPWKARPRSAR